MSIGYEIAGNAPERLPVEAGEVELVERAKADREAFAALYRAHVRAISGYVYRRTSDADATQDLVAEVFLRAMRRLHRFEARGIPFRHWLLRIATNTVNTWTVKTRKRPTASIDPDALAAEAAHGGHGFDGDVSASLREIRPRYQEVLTLHYVEGFSVSEVAGILGCREGTVKSRLSRGREALRRRLESRRPDHE